MAEELSGQADQLQSTMSYFKVRTDERRMLSAPPQTAAKAAGAGQASAATLAATPPAAAPAAAPATGAKTGITLPMDGGNGTDAHDDDFEEF